MAPTRRRKSGTKNKTAIVKSSKEEAPRGKTPNHSRSDDTPAVKSKEQLVNPPSFKPAASKVTRESKSKASEPGRSKKDFTAAQLIEKAEGFLDTFEYELAEKFCLRALELEPNNATVNHLHGSILTELGDIDSARKAFKRSIDLDPEGDYQRYLSYAQLIPGKESCDAYTKAISLVRSRLEALSSSDSEDSSERMDSASSPALSSEEIQRMKNDLSSAFCAVAELYMTDLCDEANAENECLQSIKNAIGVDESNPEGYQSMASYYLVKSDNDQAKAFMEKSLSLWLEDHKAARSGAETKSAVDPVLPGGLTYSARVGAAKLCIELDMWNEGTEVLDGLIDENDEDEETWYLLGYLNYLRGGAYLVNAKHFFDTAIKLMKVKGDSDTELLESAENLLAEVKANPEVPDDDDEEDDDVTDAMGELEIDSTGDEDDDEDDSEEERKSGTS